MSFELPVYETTDIILLARDEIDANYTSGSYAGVEVIIHKKSRFINASKLAALEEKQISDWMAGKEDYFKEIEDEVNIHPSFVDGDDVYVHPILVPHIASWMSVKFAMKMARIVNSYIIYVSLDKKTAAELKRMCRDNKWVGWSKMKKDELIKFITGARELV